MRQLRLIIRYTVWLVVFASVGCGRKSVSQVVGESPVAQSPSTLPTTSATQAPASAPSVTPSPEAKPGQTASSDLSKLEKAVQPSVILVTVFDPKGNLLRTQSADAERFFYFCRRQIRYHSTRNRRRSQCCRKNRRRWNLQRHRDCRGFERIGPGRSASGRQARSVSCATQEWQSVIGPRDCDDRQCIGWK